jgi:hypothetical protein
LSAQWLTFANKALGKSHRNWFSQLPRRLNLDFNGKKSQVVHGSISCINEFLFPSSAEISFRKKLQRSDADIILAGHCGISFSKKLTNGFGIIQARSACPLTMVLAGLGLASSLFQKIKLLLTAKRWNKITLMRKAGLNNACAAILSSGLWPSMDVLPEEEKRKRGVALNPTTTIF